MEPRKVPFTALIVGLTNSGKTRYILNQLRGPFRGKFDYIVLICPTFVFNKIYDYFVDNEPRLVVINCQQHEVEAVLSIANFHFEKANTLISLDDCATSKDVKGRTSQLVALGFSARHGGLIFEDYAGELSHEEYKGLVAQLKGRKYPHIVFSLRYPYGIEVRKYIYIYI